MASNCKACTDLRDYAPEFVTNGVTDNVCLSLENDNGLGNHADHTDCDDLHDAVDCLVGNMDDEIEAYEICGWKKYMHELVPNLHHTIKAVICAVCGLWNNVCRLWCYINFFLKGVNVNITEATTDDSYVVAGRGVSFLARGGGSAGVDVQFKSYGNIIKFRGSVKIYTSNTFNEPDGMLCSCFDRENGTMTKDVNERLGNRWYAEKQNIVWGGELLYELRIKKEAYPMLKHIEQGFGMATDSDTRMQIINKVFDEGSYAYGYHGACDQSTGDPKRDGFTKGHLVPEGWIYVQQRIINYSQSEDGAGSDSGKEHSPRSIVFVEFNEDDLECGAIGNHEDCQLDLHQVEE